MREEIQFHKTIPILRIFDIEKAKEFYMDILEYTLDWEHAFETSFPLYMQVSKGNSILHLSEHHGDCSPGAAIRMEVEGIEEFLTGILRKNYRFAKPAIEHTPWKTKEFQIIDPFGNKLIYYQELT
ncbi:VOC family protein [Rossellomorea aquimaris]|uniref:glyoxalase superfamily protein n=1 Tax=Rossellomorea aquimaris TaxID=189382 RepID=UPI001CD302DC|nr:glyoxalase superfamily protein [Rossellomorea aquimaris]MCA1060709.1 VOC family protein [Rossellomorea aquimaris]